MLKKITVSITFVLLFCVLINQWAFAAENLLKNASFEEIENNEPVGWSTWVWNKQPGVAEFGVGQEGAHSGQYYVTIENKEERDARYLQEVAVEPKTCYRLSGWIKTENVGEETLGANLSIERYTTYSNDIRGTVDEWQYTELYILTGEDVNTLKVSLGLGGYGRLNTGKASFDDIVLEKLDGIPEGERYLFVGNTDSDSNGSKDEKDKSPENTEGKYTWIWFVISAIVLATILYYYYGAGKLKGSNGENNTKNDNDTNDEK
ncbi:carbohydrate binding domain-containing protein [Acetivibrio straminisolvens]|jgi:hypothetical protein|uniref:CBM-cenC domain-containing protein n=1 Tax=Acetivibrio straminisolvens JCM 21531 TaxID=1294263 RepID=W4V982_9FIRM|nr:carbohydrate binding domain-containing protein [Acetivibrio straminisolvens]GAE89767.1 hypothetical protein JCM21531_3325 [Acetivibrio straminisolvens JCM 21531]